MSPFIKPKNELEKYQQKGGRRVSYKTKIGELKELIEGYERTLNNTEVSDGCKSIIKGNLKIFSAIMQDVKKLRGIENGKE